MTYSKDYQLPFEHRRNSEEIARFIENAKLEIARAYIDGFEAVDRVLNIAGAIITNSGLLKEKATGEKPALDQKVLREKIAQVLAKSFSNERLRFHYLESWGPMPEIVSPVSLAVEKWPQGDGTIVKSINVKVSYTFPVASIFSIEYLIHEKQEAGKRLLGWTLSEFTKQIQRLK